MLNSKKNIYQSLDLGDGYILGTLSTEDLDILRNVIEKQYRDRLLAVYPAQKELIEAVPLESYHSLTFMDHKILWPKDERTLSESDICIFKETNFFKGLENIFGDTTITNEDKTRSQEIYWRLVRPQNADDVGPLHADSWFWNLHNGGIDKNFRRLKIWISIFNQPKQNGFRLIPNSQKIAYKYQGEIRDGKMKPVNDPMLENDRSIVLVPTKNGDFILFHDDLIHGGFVGGDKTRISIEFTILVRK